MPLPMHYANLSHHGHWQTSWTHTATTEVRYRPLYAHTCHHHRTICGGGASLIPPPPVGIQQRSCDVVCALCELRLVDKMSVEVLMPLASALIKTTLNWKSEVGVLGKVGGKRRGGWQPGSS